MAEKRTRADWRPPTDQDWRQLRTLLSDLIGHLERDAGYWDQLAQDTRATGGDPGRYADCAIRDRELAMWVEEEYRALGGEDRCGIELNERGVFPGTSVP